MWLKIARIVAQVAIATGAVDWAKSWLKRQLQKQLDKAKAKAEQAVAVAEAEGIKGIYGITINRKRAPKEVLRDMAEGGQQ